MAEGQAEELKELIEQQSALQQAINQLISNTKKDSANRKTKEYLQKRLAELDRLWAEYQERHEQILTYDADEEQYIQENFLKSTRNTVDAGKTLIKSTYQTLYPTSTKDTTVHSEKTITQTLPPPPGLQQNKQNEVQGSLNNLKLDTSQLKRLQIRLQRMQRNTKKAVEHMRNGGSKIQYEHSVQELSTQIDNLELLLEEALISDTDASQMNEIMNEFEDIVGRGHETIFELRKAIESLKEENPRRRPPKLAPVSIPKFNGKFNQWIAFKNLFINVIHENDTLSEVEKLRYLQTNLEGEPSKMITHLHLTNENYEVAWQIIMQRYENPRKIVTTYFDALLGLPTCSTKTGVKLLHDTLRECIEGLRIINMITDESPIITHIGINKLDTENLKAFEESLDDQKQFPTVNQLLNFLETRQLLLETINEKRNPKQGVNVGQMTHEKKRCALCQGEHKLYRCPGFEKLTGWERSNFVNKKRICRNCLSHKTSTKCFSKFVCTECQNRHHTLLHYQKDKVPEKMPNQSSGETSPISSNKKDHQPSGSNTTAVAMNQTIHNNPVLLSTALIYIKARCGRFEPFRALIDQGSQASLITERAAQILELPRMASNVEVTGLGANKPKNTKHKILIEIRPHFSNTSELQVETHVLSKLTSELPNENIIDDKNRWDNIILADPNYDTPGPIDVILGADIYNSIVLKGIKVGNPTAYKTKLGWILNGPTSTVLTSKVVLSHVTLADVQESMTRFWDIEEVTQIQEYTEDDEIANKAKIKKVDGRYTVNLPFKRDTPVLGQSRKQAVARFFQVEKMLQANPKKRKQYHAFMSEYLQLGHMELINSPSLNNECGYYLPHHGVWKTESITTKLRVVFDASAVTTNNRSLNDELLIGPTIQENLTTILTRWRTHRYVFTADIEKMYRQIQIAKEDQEYQKILWRFSTTEPIQEFKLTTVTYGTASAPYLAIRTLHQLADDEANEENVEIIKIIKRDFYVDDLMSGADSLDDARHIINQLNSILNRGGFSLRKWMSNENSILNELPDNLKLDSLLEINKDSAVKTLGVWWNPASDKFTFKIHIASVKKRTKRMFLSNMSKLFDPMGWLAPITVTSKMMIQELWAIGCDWDEELPEAFQRRWQKVENDMPQLERVEIPRFIQTSQSSRIEIHGFCDASEKAYAAVVYAKVINEHGCNISILGAKTRVAPLNKEQTIPRLELCGAVLLTNYVQEVMKAFQFKNQTPVYYWTDSKITLAWITGQPQKWKTFVSHRVVQINKLSSKEQWYYVSSAENPADIASRGASPTQIIQNQLWWQGPQWLQNNWLETIEQPIVATTEETKSSSELALTTLVSKTELTVGTIINRFSSFGKLIRVVSYMKRFQTKIKGHLTVKELKDTTMQLVKLIQSEEYGLEIDLIRKQKNSKMNNKLLKLNPFLDKDGTLRVGGRLDNLQITAIEKHPIILPASHHLSTLITDHAHKQTLHGGNQLTLAYIRQTYWIPNARTLVRKVIHNCTRCHRFRAETAKQLMGNLPTERITPAPAFTNTGVDYAGPFEMKVSKVRGTKVYKGFVSVFVCVATRAIHLEAVSDMTSEAFLAAYKRFISRRGKCLNIYSDNGRTFIGADNQMKREFKALMEATSEAVAKVAVEAGTTWHFIPPRAPHVGGIWEAAVKSMKYHLKRVIGEQILTFEELTTVLSQIEACLNSRPIAPLSDDPTDLAALTPGHFLIGRPLLASPERDLTNIRPHTRWNLLSKTVQQFWKVWSTEYLSKLQQRSKWLTVETNIKPGELVLIKDENLPPTKWSLGRVIETHPGKDDLVRTITLRGPKNTILKRPITKICPLPIHEVDKSTNGEPITEPNKHSQALKEVDKSTNGEPITEPNKHSQSKVQMTSLPIKANTQNKSVEPSIPPARSCRQEQEKSIIKERAKILNKTIANNRKRPGVVIRPHIAAKVLVAAFTICTLSAPVISTQQFAVQEITQAGLLFAHDHSTLIQLGTWTITFQTNINTNSDIEKLQNIERTFSKMCEDKIYLKNNTDNCSNDIRFIASEVKFIMAQISQIPRHRNKRSSGILGFLRDLLFGKSDHDEIEELKRTEEQQSRRTSGVILSTIDAVSASETKIQQQMYQVNQKLSDAIKEINNARKWKDQINHETLEYHTTTAFEHAVAIIHDIKNHYNQLRDNMVIHKQELDKHIQTIRAAIPPDTTTLDLSLPDLNRLGLQRQYQRNGSIEIEMNIPIISMHIYETFKVVSIPNLKTKSIIDVKGEFIAVNYDLQSYFYPNNNEGYNIDNDRRVLRRTIFKSINSKDGNNSCIAASLFKKQSKNCKAVPLPDAYDLWTELHQHNTFIFCISNPEDISIICNFTRHDIKVKIGLLKAPSGCHIKTPNFNIISSTDAAHSEKNLYFQQQEFTIENSTIIPGNDIIDTLGFSPSNMKINFSEIQNQARELPIQFVDNHSFWTSTIPLICGIVSIITMAVIIIYWWKKRQYNHNQGNSNHRANNTLDSIV